MKANAAKCITLIKEMIIFCKCNRVLGGKKNLNLFLSIALGSAVEQLK